MPEAIVTSMGIVYHTRLRFAPHHEKGRMGPPLVIQESEIPDGLREQILALVQEAAEKYWAEVQSKSQQGGNIERKRS